MRVHFIFPKWEKLLESNPELREEIAGYEIGSFRMVSLGVSTAAACLPEGVEVTLQDENLAEVDYGVEADLIALGFFTPQASSAYRIADRFRALGKPTLAGGIHPTMAPDDTLEHFDSVVVGEVEGLWETILEDLRQGALRRSYRQESRPDPLFLKPPLLGLFKDSTYLKTGVIQIARGCYYGCGFCIVPWSYGVKLRFRPVPEVLQDIRSLPYQSYYIADENLLFGDEESDRYTATLMEAIVSAGIRKAFYTAAYPDMIRRLPPERMALLNRAGCRQVYMIFGMDRPLGEGLRDPAVVEHIRQFEEAGIEIMASFTLGHDGDDASSGDLILEFCQKARLNLVEFTIFTPFPGTPLFRTAEREGRLLTREWGKYNAANVVFRPKHFTPDELKAFYLEMWRRFYRDISPFEIRKRYVKAFTGSILFPSQE